MWLLHAPYLLPRLPPPPHLYFFPRRRSPHTSGAAPTFRSSNSRSSAAAASTGGRCAGSCREAASVHSHLQSLGRCEVFCDSRSVLPLILCLSAPSAPCFVPLRASYTFIIFFRSTLTPSAWAGRGISATTLSSSLSRRSRSWYSTARVRSGGVFSSCSQGPPLALPSGAPPLPSAKARASRAARRDLLDVTPALRSPLSC